ncbi:MAG TPA: carbon-nitrogen hydrolase family protein [Patescibacteria group bacterium]|nr:carbon-nitrogen hydrolase family protein [Patescibacteria group bacterium]
MTQNTNGSKNRRLLAVAIAQLDCNFDTDIKKRMQANLGKLTAYTALIKELRHPDLILFPEVFIQGPDGNNAAALAEPIPSGPTTQALIKLAKEQKVWLVPGTLMEKGDNGKIYNTAIVISPDGAIVAKYRKAFPARPLEPSDMGDKFVVFDIPGKGRIGIMICYDAQQPEVARTLAWMGAEVILKPTFQDDSEGGEACRMPIVITRAIENQAYVVDCNAAAPLANGHSAIIDPEGRVVEKLSTTEAYTSAVLDLDKVYQVREYGSFAGGFTFLKFWAYQRAFKNFPPYEKGIENGEVFKGLSKTYPNDPSQVKPYGD